MKTLPAALTPFHRSPVFTEASVPAALQRSHRTKSGLWGQIVVLEGQLTYRILEPEPETHTLTPEHPGVIAPTVPHEVAPVGPVRFYVEFYKQQTQTP